jgi:hypothetical protein
MISYLAQCHCAHKLRCENKFGSPNLSSYWVVSFYCAGYSIGPAMHHYRCQNVYITSTSSELIVDILEFFPHNLPMPQLSSADQLIMAANDMTDALRHPHPDVPFNTVGDDTISAFTTLEAIFKIKYNNSPAHHRTDSPIKAAENKRPAVLVQPVLTSPAKHNYQTRSQTQVHTMPAHVSESRDSSQLPRVVTPATRIAAPPRVPARARNLSPRNLSQGDFWDMGSANNAIPLGDKHWTKTLMMNAVIHPASGKEMQYKDIMQHPKLGTKYKTGFGNELGRVCKGIRDI